MTVGRSELRALIDEAVAEGVADALAALPVVTRIAHEPVEWPVRPHRSAFHWNGSHVR